MQKVATLLWEGRWVKVSLADGHQARASSSIVEPGMKQEKTINDILTRNNIIANNTGRKDTRPLVTDCIWERTQHHLIMTPDATSTENEIPATACDHIELVLVLYYVSSTVLHSWIVDNPAKRAYHSGRALDMELGGYEGSSDIPK